MDQRAGLTTLGMYFLEYSKESVYMGQYNVFYRFREDLFLD